MAVVEVKTRIAAPARRCFDLARSIDLHLLSTAGTREEAVAGVTTGLIGMGEEVTFRGRHFGRWREMTCRITAFDPPRHFRDEQVAGPFARFAHDHGFEEADGETVMTDRYDFAFRLHLVGRLIDRFLLAPHFARFVRERNRVLKQVAESERWRDLLVKDSSGSTSSGCRECTRGSG